MISYGSDEGPVYLDMKSSIEAQKIFVNFIRDVLGHVSDDQIDYAVIKKALEPYNGAYRFNQAKAGYIKRHFIRFGTPKDLTAFLMRYS